MMAGEAPRGFSFWDFSKIPLFPPDQANRLEARSLLSTSSLSDIIHPKLVVGEVNDPLEHEANRVADQVMNMAAPDPSMAAAPSRSRKCVACGEEARPPQPRIHRSSVVPSCGDPAILQDVLHTPGQPLDLQSRAYFEPRFGHDFSHVRVHADPLSAKSAQSVGALAYTVGQHVFFQTGQYVLRTHSGSRLLAHELAHVVQYASSPQVPMLRRAPDDVKPPVPDPGHTPFNFISESPALGNWKVAVKGMLEREFQKNFSSFEEAQENFRQHLKAMPDDRGREDFADRMRDRARKAFYRKEGSDPSYAYTKEDLAKLKNGAAPESGLQLEHMEDVKTKTRGGAVIKGQPERALDSGNIYITEGGAGGTAPLGSKHAEKYRSIESAKKTSREIRDKAATSEKPSVPAAPEQVGKTPVKPPVPGGTAAEDLSQVKGSGGTKPATETDVEPPDTVGGSGAKSAPKTTAPGPQRGRFAGVGLAVGTGALSLAIGLLSSYLQAQVYQKIVAKQIDRNQARAEKEINTQADTILKMMLTNPEQTLFARVIMTSAVISTIDATGGGEPTVSDSAPLIDLTGIGFTFVPLAPGLGDTMQLVDVGAHHFTTARVLISEIPLETPPIEELIAYAKARKWPLEDLFRFVADKMAGLDDKKIGAQKYIEGVNYWTRILYLIGPVTPKP
jgi:hypothetical protein